MLIRVIAQEQNEFEKWVKQQQKDAITPTNDVTRAGSRLFLQKACASCHAIRGTAAISHMAPDLTHLASRKTILSGMLPLTDANLRHWLQKPQKIKPGANMPDFMLSPQEMNALTKYLEELQ